MATDPLELETRQSQILTQKSIEADEAKDIEQSQFPCPDQDLQLSRRLDWRFLLPNPHLGRVGYLGPSGGTLPRALREFSDSLRMIPPSTPVVHALNQPLFDLVVLHSRSRADAARASAFLRPRGVLYWEIAPINGLALRREIRRDRQKERWRLPLIRDPIAILQQLGLCDIEAYWHRPSFERCSEIIPLNHDLALEYIFSRNHEGFTARLQLTAEWWMIKTGLLPHLAPCISLIARLPSF